MKTIKQETYLVTTGFAGDSAFEIKVYDGYKMTVNIILRYTGEDDISFPFLNRTENICTEDFLDELIKIKKSEIKKSGSNYFIKYTNTDYENIYQLELCRMHNGLSLDFEVIECYYITEIDKRFC